MERDERQRDYTGGCLCGTLRYEASGEPAYAAYCYCGDCRKASGSGFIPFMRFPASALRIKGETRKIATRSARGGGAVRSTCAVCGSLVFGGECGKDDWHTIYPGSLDDPSRFHPTTAIFTRNRPAWVVITPKPEGL